jgi:tetratricopeptide (TPR) repeat protein
VHYWLDEVDQMAALVRQVRPVLERHGTPAQRSDFFGSLLFMASRRDRYVISDETLGYGRARLAAAEEMGEPFQLATAQFNLGFSLLFYGNLDEAERRFLEALGFAERAGDVTLQARSLTYLSILYRKRGLVDEVCRYVERSLVAAEAGGMVEYVAVARANRSWLAWRAGNLAEAEREGRAAVEELRALPIPYPLHLLALWPLIAVALARGDTEGAVTHARALLPAPQQPPPEQLAVRLGAGIRLGSEDSGRRRYELSRRRSKPRGTLHTCSHLGGSRRRPRYRWTTRHRHAHGPRPRRLAPVLPPANDETSNHRWTSYPAPPGRRSSQTMPTLGEDAVVEGITAPRLNR